METKTELRTDEDGAFFEITATARVRVAGATALAREASKCGPVGDFMRRAGLGTYIPENEIKETELSDMISATVLAAALADAMNKARLAEIFFLGEPGTDQAKTGRFVSVDMETGKRTERGC